MVTELEQPPEWVIVGDTPPNCVDFGAIGERIRHTLVRGNPNPLVEVTIETDRRTVIAEVENGPFEELARSSIHDPNWMMIVRHRVSPIVKSAAIVARGIALGGIAIGVYKLYKNPEVERVAEGMRRKLERMRQPH